MNKKFRFYLVAVIPLLVFSGCWQAGEAEYVGIVTKVAHIGAVFETWEGELHLVDQKGTMVADSVEFSVDDSELHGESRSEIVKALKASQQSGTRVKITVKREMFVGCWRAEHDRMVVKVESLP